jgi:hypothetical protein
MPLELFSSRVSVVSLNTLSLYLMFISGLIKRSLKKRKAKTKIMRSRRSCQRRTRGERKENVRNDPKRKKKRKLPRERRGLYKEKKGLTE